ncbi:hypothetical protein [Helicobacter suis]|uniref:hypothetical protein n=1 Tax=Helicobacter suis TaxID=104628 RepID=UPI0022060C28|nr:hypothetical protein [Helicobacter suis]BDR28112.1 hypothetical protein HSHS1_08730 [Helicobacter suis HS1]
MAKAILETSGKCESNTSYALIEANRVKDIFKGSSLPSYNTQHIKLFASERLLHAKML